MKKVILVDALNLFIRNYVVNPTLDSKGNPIGGCVGFMKSLQKICRKTTPDEIVICWDGIGGSQKRKKQNKNYKAGRKPIRFNRRMIKLDEGLQEQNKIYQQIRLCEYLNEMPVIQTSVSGVEADDVIAYIANHEHYKDWKKVIISSDKDFFQLCNKKIVVYRPIQDVEETEESLTEKFGIHPNNFALARAMVGDKSDNLKGVERVGMKTVANLFPFLYEKRQYDVEHVIDYCKFASNIKKSHQNIINSETLIKENYQIMQLYEPMMSYTSKQAVDYNICEWQPEFNKLNVTKMLFQDGLTKVKLSELYAIFRSIVS